MECIMRTTVLLTGLGSLALAGLVPVASRAAGHETDLDYTYIQLNGISRDIKGVGTNSDPVNRFDNGSGVGLFGSYQFAPKWFLFGDYSSTNSDVNYTSSTIYSLPSDTDIKRLDFGFGTHRPITDRIDFVGRLGYTDVDYGKFKIGAGGGLFSGGLSGLGNRLSSDTSDGYIVDAAVRAPLTHSLQGEIGVRHLDINTVTSNNIIGSLLYQFSDDWGLDFGVDAGSDISTYVLGVRFTPG